MAMAVRALARRALRKTLPSLSSPTLVPASSSSFPAVTSNDESLLLRCFSTFSFTNGSSKHVGEELERFQSLPHLRPLPSTRVFSTDVAEKEEEKPAQEKEQPKVAVKPPPRPFRLNSEQRKLAQEVGYKVIDRYTEEDFGRNKKPKAFAVIQIGSHQFKVSPGDIIYTEKLKFCDINDKLMLSKVLLLGSKTQTIVGRPVVPGSAVFAVVEEHALDEKVIIFKKKRRKNYRRTTGHRQELTRLRILDIKGISLEATTPATPAKIVEKASSPSRAEEASPPTAEVGYPSPVLA